MKGKLFMINYDSIEYKNNILHQVIIRVDFTQFIATELVFNSTVDKEILNHFPNKGMAQIVRYNTLTEHYEPGNTSPEHNLYSKEGQQREYISKDKKNKLVLSNKHIVFEINLYENYEQICSFIKPIFEVLFSQTHLLTKRVGVRYINILNSDKMPIRKKYFSNEISSIINTNAFKDNSDISLIRSMQSCEYIVDDMILCFRYGLYNPQYPGMIANNSFSLDYDCYTGELFDTSESVIKTINKGHKYIQVLFESSITDSLRKVMNE